MQSFRAARLVLLCLPCIAAAAAIAAPVHLRTDDRMNPLGIDDAQPVFSWQSDATTQDWKQSGYEVLVASTPAALTSGKADIWDSGRVSSAQSVNVPYAGPQLRAGQRCYWTVRTWDEHGIEAKAAEPAWWEMGLLSPEDWHAQWIREGGAGQQPLLDRVQWIWLNGDAATKDMHVQFRTTVHLDAVPPAAKLHIYASGVYTARVNGKETGSKNEWGSFDDETIGYALHPGDNAIVVDVTVPRAMQAGFSAAIELGDQPGNTKWIVSDHTWQARAMPPATSASGTAQDSASTPAWAPAYVVGPLTAHHYGVAPDRHSPAPPPDRITFGASLFRKQFESPEQPVSARLYITAMGAYQAFLNGEPVGDDLLTPGFTDFRKRVRYQTYDVTSMLRSGANTLAATVAEGWYGSPLLWSGSREFPGPQRLRAQLELTYRDGSHHTVATDDTWQTTDSPITSSTIYGGEDYDARLVQAGWDTTGFRPRTPWEPAVADDADVSPIVSAQPDQPIRQQLTVTPIGVKRVLNPASGQEDAVFNMGQNMVGAVRLRVHGPRGTVIRLRFAERLNPDGTIYTENLRDASATDTYTLSGNGEEEWTPQFTFHGFQYVEVAGYPGPAGTVPPLSAIEGIVRNSLPETPSMRLETSSPLLDKMDQLGLWGQRGNFVSIPTDCPQRDERMGWMGDAGVFWRTGSYNFNIDAFSHSFVQDEDDAQLENGAFTNISPNLLYGTEATGAPGWGDAGIIVPYATWLQYGDKAVLEQAWPGMVRWMDFILKNNPDYVRRNNLGPDYADWLAPDPNTPGDLVGTAYWALVAQQMQAIAAALGKADDAAQYAALYDHIRDAYGKAYIHADGSVVGDTQSAYVLTLYTGLAPKALEASMTDRLVANIHAHHDHLTTGFLGTPFLLSTLDEQGRSDMAYTLLLTTGYPSWGYMVSKGATTWWERWNGDTGDPSMNSYNHYSFGSVMAWVYRRVAGIDTFDGDGAGFHHIRIHPEPDPRLPHVHGSYDSPYGVIETDVTLGTRTANSTAASNPAGAFHLTVRIPANTTATVELPAKPGSHITEDGKLSDLPIANNLATAEIGSGTYHFDVTP